MDGVLEAVREGKFLSVVSGAGVVRIWETRQACYSVLASKEREKVLADEKALRLREEAELGEAAAAARARERNFNRDMGDAYALRKTPLWRAVSGILGGIGSEDLHPEERAGRIMLLLRAVEKVVRYEWRAFEKKFRERDPIEEAKKELRDPRVRWWDPMRLACEHFGIAYSALSRLGREVAGLSASDLTDRVKAETVRSRMKEDVKQWVWEIYEADREELNELKPDEVCDVLWSRVAVERGRGRWSRASWAGKFGFSSYTRFQRACLAEYGVSPVELERAVLEEVVRERGEATTTGAVLERGEPSADCEGRSATESGDLGGIEGVGRGDAAS